MFSFHKPRIYRSIEGCCICRAKSSSSRFTDSGRYESEFENCFHITETRSGEICNACVLLVKRWKKLPLGTNRDWSHVVDARAGPGTKSLFKVKNKSMKVAKPPKLSVAKRVKEEKKKRLLLTSQQTSYNNLTAVRYSSVDTNSLSSDSSSDDEVKHVTCSTSRRSRFKNSKPPVKISSFLDLNFWKRREICCGTIFTGPNESVLIDTSLLHKCQTNTTPLVGVSKAHSVISDGSSEGLSPIDSPPMMDENSNEPTDDIQYEENINQF
ncbi:FAM60A (predicted) [Pycnogonum litorale]